jgi:hypothetical protein
MSSEKLQQTQNELTELIIAEIKKPMKNWSLIKKYLDIIKDVDNKRRKEWHDEKFKVYENIVDDLNDSNSSEIMFCEDDIPF